jgi:hypothetical protein
VQGYLPDNIYNMDETAYLFRAQPKSSLSKDNVSGGKVAKDRLTVGLCVNSTGTDKLKPLVIWKFKKPRDFGKTFDPSRYVEYHSNPSAWMNTKVDSPILCFYLHTPQPQVLESWNCSAKCYVVLLGSPFTCLASQDPRKLQVSTI